MWFYLDLLLLGFLLIELFDNQTLNYAKNFINELLQLNLKFIHNPSSVVFDKTSFQLTQKTKELCERSLKRGVAPYNFIPLFVNQSLISKNALDASKRTTTVFYLRLIIVLILVISMRSYVIYLLLQSNEYGQYEHFDHLGVGISLIVFILSQKFIKDNKSKEWFFETEEGAKWMEHFFYQSLDIKAKMNGLFEYDLKQMIEKEPMHGTSVSKLVNLCLQEASYHKNADHMIKQERENVRYIIMETLLLFSMVLGQLIVPVGVLFSSL